MSLRPALIPVIPAETVRFAQAAFPKGNTYLLLKEELGSVYEDELFAHLFPERGQPAASPWQLALITVWT
jgi:transposase